jgi:hypothetical protein
MLHDLLILFTRLEASFSIVSVALVFVTFKFVQTKLLSWLIWYVQTKLTHENDEKPITSNQKAFSHSRVLKHKYKHGEKKFWLYGLPT